MCGDGVVTGAGVHSPRASELLGFAGDARVLIVNCDDLGMSESVNAGVLRAVQEGVASSCSLMVPCPAAAQAMRLLREEPDVSFGVHLTLTRDHVGHRWAPVRPANEVPSLVDDDGLLLTSGDAPWLLARARIEDVERELQAQIDVVTRAGLTPTHLDWHVLADGGRPDLLDLTVDLAIENGLAARVWLEPGRRSCGDWGLPVVDHDFLDSFSLEVPDKAQRYVQLLRALPAGLSEWAVHPAVEDGARPAGNASDTAVRRSDHDFLISAVTRRVIAEEGIRVIDYRRLQHVWAAATRTAAG